MPKFEMRFTSTGTVIAEAESEDEAEAMFLDGEIEFDFSDGASITDITPVEES